MQTFTTLGKSHPIVELAKNNYQYPTTDNRSQLFNACNGPYALCTSAACEMDASGNETCYCDVLNGTSISLVKPCQNLQPFTRNGKSYVYSLYSGIGQGGNGQPATIQKVTCSNVGGRWADCLNKICMVDPKNTSKAYCHCGKGSTSAPWITFQDINSTTPCPCNNLSGATPDAATIINYVYEFNMNIPR